MKQLVKLLPGAYLDPAEISVVRVVGEDVYVGLGDGAHFLRLASVAGSVDTVAETLVSRINAVLAERHHGFKHDLKGEHHDERHILHAGAHRHRQ